MTQFTEVLVSNTGLGSVELEPGSNVSPGYIQFFTPDGTRRGYIGYSQNNAAQRLCLNGDNGWIYDFSVRPSFNFATPWDTTNLPIISLSNYGGIGDGSTDNTNALNAALNALPSSGGIIFIPPGTFRVASAISYGVPNFKKVSLVGAGGDASILYFSGAGGLTFNYTTTSASLLGSVHVSNISITTGQTNAGSGLTLSNTGTAASNPANTALNTIVDVTFRGQDNYGGAYGWANALQIEGVSNVNIERCNITGSGQNGSGIYIFGTASSIPVQVNITSCNLLFLATGVSYGNYAQGVTISQCNFDGCSVGVGTGAGLTGLLELIVTACQFGVVNEGILINSSIVDIIISSNLFLINNQKAGIQLDNASGTVINGNIFSSGSTAGGYGVVVVSTPAGLGGGMISGNSFAANLGYGVWLQSSANYFNVQSNYYHGDTTNVRNDGGATNTIGGGSA